MRRLVGLGGHVGAARTVFSRPPFFWLACWFLAILGGGFMHGVWRTARTSPAWYVRANPHAPTGPTWANVAPQRSFVPLGVPTGRMEHKGPRARRFAEVPELALMSTLQGSM